MSFNYSFEILFNNSLRCRFRELKYRIRQSQCRWHFQYLAIIDVHENASHIHSRNSMGMKVDIRLIFTRKKYGEQRQRDLILSNARYYFRSYHVLFAHLVRGGERRGDSARSARARSCARSMYLYASVVNGIIHSTQAWCLREASAYLLHGIRTTCPSVLDYGTFLTVAPRGVCLANENANTRTQVTPDAPSSIEESKITGELASPKSAIPHRDDITALFVVSFSSASKGDCFITRNEYIPLNSSHFRAARSSIAVTRNFPGGFRASACLSVFARIFLHFRKVLPEEFD